MAGSTKLFQFVRKCHQIFGIYSQQPNQKQQSINWIQTLFLISLALFMFTTAGFLLFVATSMFDFGFIFFSLITVTNSTAIYLIFIWQLRNTLEFIENCEKFIGKSEIYSNRLLQIAHRLELDKWWFFVHLAGAHSTAAYSELISKIELFNKLLSFGMCFTVASLLVAVIPYSVVRYYIFDMGEDSFYLFFRPWFVFIQFDDFVIAPWQIRLKTFKVLCALYKVSVWLENAIWIFGGKLGSKCIWCSSWIFRWSIFEYRVWLMLAFHVHRWRYHTGCACIQ